jgi:hypothetical protein
MSIRVGVAVSTVPTSPDTEMVDGYGVAGGTVPTSGTVIFAVFR